MKAIGIDIGGTKCAVILGMIQSENTLDYKIDIINKF